MKRFFTIVGIFTITLSGCYSSKQDERNNLNRPDLTSRTASNGEQGTLAHKGGKSPQEGAAESKQDEQKEAKESKKEKKRSATQNLLARLGKNAKIEFMELDKEIIQNDTLVQTRSGNYKISYKTACLNDSLVAQEMFNYGDAYNKSYRVLHNYETNIAMQHNGQPSGSKVINKDIFLDKLGKEFLDIAIIKHPEFVRFDEEKNEAVFQFLVGVPATDWVVLAGVNLTPQGNIRVINVKKPQME